MQAALQILASHTVGGLSLLPFISLFTNCAIWTCYGLLKADNTVLVPNLLGVLSGLFCSVSYSAYSTKSDLALYLVCACILMITGVCYVSNDADMLGAMGAVLGIVLMGSPLATLRTVVKDRSTASLPFGICLASWCNALSWLLYGWFVVHDPMVSIASPSLLACTVYRCCAADIWT